MRISPRRNCVEQRFAFGGLRRPLDHRRVELGAQLVELVEVRADHQRRLVGMLRQDRLHHRDLGVRRRAQLVPFLGFGDGVDHPLVVGHRDPDLDALGRRDPALRLDVLPRCVVPLRPDQREHVALAAVLADQRRGQAEPPPRLQVGGHPEHRRGQQMHLVVDDQAPVAAVEQLEVLVLALGAAGDHLVGGDGDRADLLASRRSTRRSPPRSATSGAISSRFHCRPATVLVTRISVVAPALAIAAAPTSVLPAPHGSTTTPEPPAQNESAAICW